MGLVLVAFALVSSSPEIAHDIDPQGAPTSVVVVAVAGVDASIEQRARTAVAARGSVVMSADATRQSLASANELGLRCGAGDDANDCWRRVAALAHEDAVVVVRPAPNGVALRLLDARGDVAARDASASDVDSAVATLFPRADRVARTTPDDATNPTTTTTTTPPTHAPDAAVALDATLPLTLGAVSAGVALASGVGAIVIQQVVLEDPAAPRGEKQTAFGAGLVLLGATALFTVGALVGGGIGVYALETAPPVTTTTGGSGVGS